MDPGQAEKIHPVIIASVILGTILIYFIISLIRHQRRSLRFHQEKVEAEIRALEKERLRIAADLHDELSPTLSGIKLMLSGFEAKNEEEDELLIKVRGHIDKTIIRMREISNNLMPRILEKRSLIDALNHNFDDIRNIHHLEINFSYNDSNIEIDNDRKLHIYRIVQEIMHNTLKHSKASMIKISIEHQDKRLMIHSSDNGSGFDLKSELRKGHGLGLRNLISRAELLNGTLTFDTSPSRGTKITLNIPV